MTRDRIMGRLATGSLAAAATLCVLATGAAAQSVIKIGAPTVHDANTVWMATFKEEVEKAGKGKYRVDRFPGSQLGSLQRSLEGVELGTIELTITIPEFMGGLDKRFGVISIPGVFDDTMNAYRTVQDPEFKKAYWTMAEGKGVKFAGMYCPNDTAYVFRDKVTSLAGFRGKKIRTFPSKVETATLGVLGATPAPMSLNEVLSSLQRGMIDGSKSGITVFVGFKYETTAPYAIRTAESMICVPIVASKMWFDKLPGDMQQAVLDAGKLSDKKAQAYAVTDNENAYKAWVANGGKLTTLTHAERAAFMKRLAVVPEKALKGEPEMLAMFHLMKKIADRTRKE